MSKPSPLEQMTLTVNGMRMVARVSKNDPGTQQPPLVLVHGLSVSSRYLVPLAEELAPDVRVYAPDLPGFGKSVKPRRALTIHQMADTLHDWMQAAGLPRATLLGHSLGCQIIADLAVHFPETLACAVLVSPTMDIHARTNLGETLRGMHDLLREPLSLMPILLVDYLSAGLPRTLKTLSAAVEDPVMRKLARMHAPALVIRGAMDPVVSQPWAEQVTAALPHGRLEVIPGAHAVQYEHPAEVARLVRAFLGITG